jgi:hypothetical protein
MATVNPQIGVLANQPLASEKTYSGLRIFNGVMGILHLLQGIAMILLSNNFTLPFTTTYLKFEPATRTLGQNLHVT